MFRGGFLLAAAVAVIAGGCGGGSPSPAAAPSRSTQAPPVTASPASPSALPLATAAASASTSSHEVPALEARLPNALRGVSLTKFSLTGAEFLSPTNPVAKPVLLTLVAIGKTAADFSAAGASDRTGQLDVDLGAFEFPGTDASSFLDTYLTYFRRDNVSARLVLTSLGGKNVVAVSDAANPSRGTTYFYASGDAIFFVESSDPRLAAEALATLH